jgi:hypothetical protein
MGKPSNCRHAAGLAGPRARRSPSFVSTAGVTIALAVLQLAMPLSAHAWGPLGHRVVAELAERQLDPAIVPEIRRLLDKSGASNLAEVANWADDVRDSPDGGELSRKTKRMHFVNFADSRCQFEPARICAHGQCAVAAIESYAKVLADRSKPDNERAQALRFLVHFVGDIHQPLHASYRPDRGGNQFQVRYHGQGTNLHAIWDSRVLGSLRIGWQRYARRLDGRTVAAGILLPRAWAEQSCRISRDDGIYPLGRSIDAAYLERMRPIAELQVRRAAARLAALLNQALG